VGVLDHHKTALETLPPPGSGPRNLHTLLDMNRSGATVSWDYFAAKYRQDLLEVSKQRNSEASADTNSQGSAAPGLADELNSRLTTELTPDLAAAPLSTAAESFREHSGQSPDVHSSPPVGSSESGPSASTSRKSTESGAFGLSPEKSASLRRLFEYIEDADLWRWALPDSKAFSSGLKDLDIEYDARANPGVFDQVCEHLARLSNGYMADKETSEKCALLETCDPGLLVPTTNSAVFDQVYIPGMCRPVPGFPEGLLEDADS
jgi:hypothetical protein